MAKQEDYGKDYCWYKVNWDNGQETFEKILKVNRPEAIFRVFLREEEEKRAKLNEQEPRKIVEAESSTYSEYLKRSSS